MASVADVVASVVLVGMLGCPATDCGEPEVLPMTPPKLEIELPPGVQVEIDGKLQGTTPLDAIEVTAGTHRVQLRTACHSVELPAVAVSWRETVRLDATSAMALEFATYVAKARALDGTPLAVGMFVGDAKIADVAHAQSVILPACPLRITLAHEGLGSFVEDVEMLAGATVTREVVLAPGPDMVRIRGGDFVAGISEAEQRRLAMRDDEDDDDESYAVAEDEGLNDPVRFLRRPVRVATFDIDRHEVTAEQFAACRKASRRPLCRSKEECAAAGGCPLPSWESDVPPKEEWPYCTLESENFLFKVKETHRKRPANCIEHWKAEDYCRWVGKRLPTEVEWEYAARSRRTDYEQPWGTGADLDCSRTGCTEERWIVPEPVCSHPTGNTEQGLCDMMGNVSEYVSWVKIPGRDDEGVVYTIKGYPSSGELDPSSRWTWAYGQYQKVRSGAALGFRCARDVEE